eukprot:TRINITY_DN8725_c0_g2_i1.p1 TRINITY_DN8725_c0_g2~~TRINITY_DN8725_c0_g2_i1.p1  ORF type:complete len:647 (+),score=121.68 TRINITY_DN8725_c0_g2_i1:86-2026(+)
MIPPPQSTRLSEPWSAIETEPAEAKGLAAAAPPTPRLIAKELIILQQSFVEAHERQVERLQKLLAAAGIPLPSTGDASCDVPKERAEDVLLNGARSLDGGIHSRTAATSGALCCSTRFKDAEKCSTSQGCVNGQEQVLARSEMRGGEAERLCDRGLCKDGDGNAAKDRKDDNSSQSSSKLGVSSRASKEESLAPPTRVSASSMVGLPASTSGLQNWQDNLKKARASERHSDGLDDILNTLDGGLRKMKGQLLAQASLSDRIYDFTEHHLFDLFCGFAIILNAILMAYETELKLTQPVGAPSPAWIAGVGRIFTAFFLCELLLRMAGGLRRFFCTCNLWNYFDLIIVTISLVDEFLQNSASLNNARMVRILRLTRIIKVIRMVRIIRMVSALRTLVNSLVGTIKQVIWAFFLIICVMSVFAVVFGQVISLARQVSPEIMEVDGMGLHWGTLSRCMYTLYLSVSGGVSWMEVAKPLQELGGATFGGFMVYVALIQWVVLNVVTGCFCESAAEAARKDVSLAVQAHRADRDNFLKKAKAIFRSIDRDGSGVLNIEEMKPYLDSEPAHALFAALDLDIGDVCGLFELLDEDGTEQVDLEEFMFGCLRLRGGAKALDIAKIQHSADRLEQRLNALLAAHEVRVTTTRKSVA